MKNTVYILILLFLILSGCTDLDVDVYSDITSENFFLTEEQVLSAAGPAYSSLKGYTIPEGNWGCLELTADELLIPTRGSDWYNDGMYQRAHKHTWLPTESYVGGSWNLIYTGVANCNRVIYQYDQVEEQSEALISISNELHALRAFYYYMAMDLFGDVPLVDRYDVDEDFAPSNTSRSEIYDFVETSLIDVIPSLNDAVSTETYGRFHKWTAYALLAKVYLNAEVFIGESKYQQCIDACDEIINSGYYSLAGDYFSNFLIENEGSPENIFVIPYDATTAVDWGTAFNICLWTLHGSNRETYDLENAPWNGMCAVPSFYHSFDEADIRRTGLLTGQQYSSSGDSLFCTKGMNGEPLDFTIDFEEMEYASEADGARLAKYEYTGAENFQMNNDFAIFRYADILLMKAEALMRQNGGAATAEAVDLVNQVRSRAFAGDDSKLYTSATLTLDELLAERGRELYSEGWRRNDLIRFGKYNDPCDFRPGPVADTYNLFPIPQGEINANPNLVQNPGY